MLKKIFILFIFLFFPTITFAIEDSVLVIEQNIQSKINNVGVKILNANKIDKRIVFVYDKAEKKSKLKMDTALTDRQIVMYDNSYKFVENEDELAGYLSREISQVAMSYDGLIEGGVSALQIKAAPKKYEIVSDKIAVDYMVKAGYNPIGLILYINKSYPQKRFDRFSNKNLTSKRLATIYEYIYIKYPYYLANNKYFESENYQNFLLSSVNNRRMLENKIKKGSKEELEYE